MLLEFSIQISYTVIFHIEILLRERLVHSEQEGKKTEYTCLSTHCNLQNLRSHRSDCVATRFVSSQFHMHLVQRLEPQRMSNRIAL